VGVEKLRDRGDHSARESTGREFYCRLTKWWPEQVLSSELETAPIA
jgi:hypothetical protein